MSDAKALRTLALALVSSALCACGPDEPAEDPIFERADACAISHVLFSPREGRTLGESFAAVREVLRRVRDGESFADVARQMSDDESSKDSGGFLGFVPPFHETRFAGAIQMLRPGETRGPLHSQIGMQVLHRHSYEEGRELERRNSVVLHGFVILSKEAGQGVGDRTAEEARRAAEEALAKVKAGDMTLADAARLYAEQPQPPRPDAFVEVLRRGRGREWIFDALSKVPEGTLVPEVVVGPGRFGVLARGRLLRCVARQVLVLHAGSAERDMGSVVTRTREEAARLAQAALNEAHPDGSNWNAVVSKYGESGPNVTLGGTMGVIGNGDLDPKLEAALLDTPPGRVAKGVVETPAGFHLLYRVD